ncbi:Unknown protein [Striga hermonthica]|uniref:F-box domain-containing protein n=1 Tax=Striga hermonthica TaxID=68872 RepID=A0A9N7R3G2_STRHE|nr:Unknown protein [Striga hermonthica]
MLGRPPSPRPLVPSLSEEGETQAVLQINKETNSSGTKIRRSQKLSAFQSLPDELLRKILLYLPEAQDIYRTGLACRGCYHIIRSTGFTQAELRRPDRDGVLLVTSGPVVFIFMWLGRVVVSDYSAYKFKLPITNSCDGLVLELNRPKNRLSVANPTTGRTLRLPRLPTSMERGCYSIGCLWLDPTWAVLSVGVDMSWRNLSRKHLSLESVKMVSQQAPLVTVGFMHWAQDNTVVILDLETEIFTETRSPIAMMTRRIKGVTYLSTGNSLSLVVHCRNDSFCVWEMVNSGLTVEWIECRRGIALGGRIRTRKIREICGERGRFSLSPRGWLKYMEVLLITVSSKNNSAVIFYNLVSEEIGLIASTERKKGKFYSVETVLPHRNTLVQLQGH